MRSRRLALKCAYFLKWGIAIACLLWGIAINPAAAISAETQGAPDRCTPEVVSATADYPIPDFSKFPPFDEPLATGNQFFHAIYEQRLCQTIESFGTPWGPIALLVIGNEAVAYHNDRREVISGLSPALYHALKAIGHQALAFQLTIRSQSVGSLQGFTRDRLESQLRLLGEMAAASDAELAAAAETDAATGRIPDTRDWLPTAQASAREILQVTRARIEAILAADAIAPDDLAQYRQKILPAIVAGANLAAAAQLSAIDTRLGDFFAEVRGQEFYVAIAGAHQPRAGEVNTQYFSQVLGETSGIGARGERHSIYAEGQFTEAALLGTLARHILDREIGTDFFQDPTRLQRDLLSDAAAQWLWQHQTSVPHLGQ